MNNENTLSPTPTDMPVVESAATQGDPVGPLGAQGQPGMLPYVLRRYLGRSKRPSPTPGAFGGINHPRVPANGWPAEWETEQNDVSPQRD